MEMLCPTIFFFVELEQTLGRGIHGLNDASLVNRDDRVDSGL